MERHTSEVTKTIAFEGQFEGHLITDDILHGIDGIVEIACGRDAKDRLELVELHSDQRVHLIR